MEWRYENNGEEMKIKKVNENNNFSPFSSPLLAAFNRGPVFVVVVVVFVQSTGIHLSFD